MEKEIEYLEESEYQEEVFEESEFWNFGMVWNKALEVEERRPIEPRDYLWASELSKSDIDVYLQMTGVEPSNYPNPRSLRKFEAGNLWEWIVKTVLKRSGILLEEQPRVYHQYPGLLKVSGKIDFIAGGKVNYDSAMDSIYQLDLPERTNDAMKQIISFLQEKFPDGLYKKAIEIKSCSSFVMNACEITEKPIEGHALQAYHYTKHPDIEITDLIYICRDDCRMKIFPIVANNSEYEKKYYNAIKRLTDVYNAGVVPPKGEPVVFDESQGRFSINRQIGWSGYLTMVYGYENQMEFENAHGKTATPWNAVLKRIKLGHARDRWFEENGVSSDNILKEKVEGKKTATVPYVMKGDEKLYIPKEIRSGFVMTEKNLIAIKEMEEHGWDIEKCASMLADVDIAEEKEDISDVVDNTG